MSTEPKPDIIATPPSDAPTSAELAEFRAWQSQRGAAPALMASAGLDATTLADVVARTVAATLNATQGVRISTPFAPVAGAAPHPAEPARPTTNISDKGRAASSDARDPRAILEHRPQEMSREDFDRLCDDMGPKEALAFAAAKTRGYLRNVKLVVDRTRR